MKRHSAILKFLLILPLAVPTLAMAAEPASLSVCWDFDSAKDQESLKAHGKVLFQQPGPRQPEFADFSATNMAIELDGKGAALTVVDGGANPTLQFTNGDAITIEAWVKLDSLQPGQQVYVIGKGRTGTSGDAYHNQNWSLRLTRRKGKALLDFLFTTRQGDEAPQWHRWRSTQGFVPSSGWHFIALTYHFGKPDSMRGWIDSIPTDGTWDLTGPTTAPPVVGSGDVWIGSSMNHNPGVSLHGQIDSIAVHRRLSTDAEMANRFHRTGGPRLPVAAKEEMPDLGDIPHGRVRYTLAEGMPDHERWPYEGETWPPVTQSWLAGEFLLPRMPLRYDEWGIRTTWKSPVLLRIAADVDLPPGNQRFLVRARGLSRLWIDGKLIATTKPDTVRYKMGRNPIHPPPEPPLPGLRAKRGNMQEVFGELILDEQQPDAIVNAAAAEGQHRRRVVLEVMVGGDGVRVDSGEVCVARLSEDGKLYAVLQPSGPGHALTEAAAGPVLKQVERSLTELDDTHRRRAAESQNEFWNQRHQLAKRWVTEHPPALVPDQGKSGSHPIDAFVEAKIERARRAALATNSQQAREFHEQILPLLRENCFRCHGDKVQGGLKLNNRADALRGGESEVPGIVPGKPEESELVSRISETDDGLRMPPTGPSLTAEQVALIEKWIREGASWPDPPIDESSLTTAPIAEDAAFVRRIYLDTVGVPPTAEQTSQFLQSTDPEKRLKLIDRLLDDERMADHWVSYWMDLLAENPSLISASLNSTGPFRWYLYESLRDHKAWDRMVTELIMMRGSIHEGGSAGFAVASENDSPFAAKGHILASAFLGIELQCARCHDSPYHRTTQQDLYSLASMLNRKPVTVPTTSRVPSAFFEKQTRESLIKVSLNPDLPVAAEWPFSEETRVEDGIAIDRMMQNPNDSRERLAALFTAPQNQRFARVVVNHLWKRLIGAGMVEPVHDWEGQVPSHPELLDWLAAEFVSHDYDVHHVIRLIVTSHVYQRDARGNNAAAPPESRFFSAPDRRRLTAEQVVDSLHAVTDSPFDVEVLSFDPDGRSEMKYRLSLGLPKRSWMMADLKNERDRPSLSLPKARMVVEVLEIFGWSGARQKPTSERETNPNVLQPGILANSVLTLTLTRASSNSSLADQAVAATSSQALTETLFLQILNRRPRPDELAAFQAALEPGFSERLVPADQIQPPPSLPPLPQITWFNHAQPEANSIQMEVERRVRAGPPSDPRLRPQWRERYEDAVWSLINHREFVWVP